MTTPHLPARAVSRGLARQAHLRGAMKPIVEPDAGPPAVRPVVADARVLLRDVAKACRQERRTILANLAGVGTIRLFCARSVLDEFAAGAVRHAARLRVPLDVYLRRWEAEYLPLLNSVDPGGARCVDHSAALALRIGAFLLSTDDRSVRAVYGTGFDLRSHAEWVAVLGAADDATGALLRSAGGVSELAGRGGVAGVRWVWNNVSPWAVAGIAAVAGFSLWSAAPEDRRRILRGAGAVAGFVGEMAVEHQVASDVFASMTAPVPAWTDLVRDVSAETVRAQACAHTLARSPAMDRSPAELATDLPPLPVSTSQTILRATLRRHAFFHESHRGRWRLGRPAGEDSAKSRHRRAPRVTVVTGILSPGSPTAGGPECSRLRL